MWRKLEEDAIRIGLDLHYFWSLNPKQFNKYIKIYNERLTEKFKEKDLLNYMLGKYISFAFNDPKEYPRKPFTEVDDKPTLMLADEMEKQARQNTILMGGVIK